MISREVRQRLRKNLMLQATAFAFGLISQIMALANPLRRPDITWVHVGLLIFFFGGLIYAIWKYNHLKDAIREL